MLIKACCQMYCEAPHACRPTLYLGMFVCSDSSNNCSAAQVAAKCNLSTSVIDAVLNSVQEQLRKHGSPAGCDNHVHEYMHDMCLSSLKCSAQLLICVTSLLYAHTGDRFSSSMQT